MGAVTVGLLFIARQLWSDGKDKDQALLTEKDRRIADATAYANAIAGAIKTLDKQSERFQAALVRK